MKPNFDCYFVKSDGDACSVHSALSFGLIQSSTDRECCYVDGVKTELAALTESGRIDAAAAERLPGTPRRARPRSSRP
jgi:hypothetical protein